MISNHAQFIDAIREKKLIRIVFYSIPDAGKVDRECAPLDYGPEPGVVDALNRYWIWDPASTAGANPLGVLSDQIVDLRVLGKDFVPDQFPIGARAWCVPRNWENQQESRTKPELITPAK